MPYLLVSVLGLGLLCAVLGERWFTRAVVIATGLVTAFVAVFLLLVTTVFPASPEHPEPAFPQVIVLQAGLLLVVAGVVPWSRLTRPGERPRHRARGRGA